MNTTEITASFHVINKQVMFVVSTHLTLDWKFFFQLNSKVKYSFELTSMMKIQSYKEEKDIIRPKLSSCHHCELIIIENTKIS